MTLESLLESPDAETYEKLTDSQLLEMFGASLDITRIDRQTLDSHKKNSGTTRTSTATRKLAGDNDKIKRLTEQFNIDFGFMKEDSE